MNRPDTLSDVDWGRTLGSTPHDTTDKGSSGELWPMGAVTRRTGITEHTLRAWERRFGFPCPVRLPSGHRRYTSEQVRQLLQINKALQCGYRAGDVVPLEPERVEHLIRQGGFDDDTSTEDATSHWVEGVLQDTLAFDETAIRAKLRSHAASLGTRRFLRERAVPLLVEVGTAWQRGDLEIRHEHFVTGILEDFLGELRRPFESAASGRPVILACLPEEIHGLGLHLVAAELAADRQKTLVLGPQTPIAEIVATAEALDAAAVGLSVSVFAPSEATTEQVDELCDALPAKTALWVGGGGAAEIDPLPKRAVRFTSLDDVAEAVRNL